VAKKEAVEVVGGLGGLGGGWWVLIRCRWKMEKATCGCDV
jgi:hypothetical protein